jgi:hypothetical protein
MAGSNCLPPDAAAATRRRLAVLTEQTRTGAGASCKMYAPAAPAAPSAGMPAGPDAAAAGLRAGVARVDITDPDVLVPGVVVDLVEKADAAIPIDNPMYAKALLIAGADGLTVGFVTLDVVSYGEIGRGSRRHSIASHRLTGTLHEIFEISLNDFAV